MEIGLNVLELHKEELKVVAYLMNNKNRDITLYKLYKRSGLCKRRLEKALAFLLDKQLVVLDEKGFGYKEKRIRVIDQKLENSFSIKAGLITRLDPSTFKVYCVLQYLNQKVVKKGEFTRFEVKKLTGLKGYAFDKAIRYLAKKKFISVDEYLRYASKYERSFTHSGELKNLGFTKETKYKKTRKRRSRSNNEKKKI